HGRRRRLDDDDAARLDGHRHRATPVLHLEDDALADALFTQEGDVGDAQAEVRIGRANLVKDQVVAIVPLGHLHHVVEAYGRMSVRVRRDSLRLPPFESILIVAHGAAYERAGAAADGGPGQRTTDRGTSQGADGTADSAAAQ